MEQREYFAKKLKELRIRRGMTITEVANEAHITRSFISMMERGCASPSMETFFLICRALHVSPLDFYLGEAEECDDKILLLTALAKTLTPQKLEIVLSIAKEMAMK